MQRTVQLVFTIFLATACVAGCGGPPPDPGRTFPGDALINPNTADKATLASVPGMNDELANAVEAARPFASATEVDAALAPLMSEEARRGAYEVMFIPVGLNTGSLEDYRLIPSTLSPGHLAHEFEEYRPYESIEQFRREMGKYVSPAEVDYLVRFVTLD